MSKNPRLLAQAYCDLVNANLSVTGKRRGTFLDSLKTTLLGYLSEHPNAGLEDLYSAYSSPADMARRIDAAMTDPECTDDDILRQFRKPPCHCGHANNTKPVIGYKKLTAKQAHELLTRLQNGEKLTPEDLEAYPDGDPAELTEMAESDDDEKPDLLDRLEHIADDFDMANELAEQGADVPTIACLTHLPAMALYLGGYGEPGDDLSEYIVPVKFEMMGTVKVKATCLDDAILTASTNDLPVPENAILVPGTYMTCHDKDTIALYTDKYRNGKMVDAPVEVSAVTAMADRDALLESMDPDHIMDLLIYTLGLNPHEVRALFDSVEDKAPVVKHIHVECKNDCDNCPVIQLLGECPEKNAETDSANGDIDDKISNDKADQVCFFDNIEEVPDGQADDEG